MLTGFLLQLPETCGPHPARYVIHQYIYDDQLLYYTQNRLLRFEIHLKNSHILLIEEQEQKRKNASDTNKAIFHFENYDKSLTYTYSDSKKDSATVRG